MDRILLRWSYRLDWRIVEGVPREDIEYMHPRYNPDGTEIYSELWGLRQDDCLGLTIWALCRWEQHVGVFRNDYVDFHLVQKLLWYLDRINSPHVPDSGIWEEEGPTKTVHLSSVAAVAAGLTQAAQLGIKDIPERLRVDTYVKILELAGRESTHHDTDLALLTLVWPFGDDLPIPRTAQREILERVERELVGSRGVVRYQDDVYNACHGGPPEWTMGFGFLALGWSMLGEPERAVWYLRRLQSAATASGEIPESWCRDSGHQECYNSPLCWSHALHVIGAVQLGRSALAPTATSRDQGSAMAAPDGEERRQAG
jgi:Glycosyl hydrolases family 15